MLWLHSRELLISEALQEGFEEEMVRNPSHKAYSSSPEKSMSRNFFDKLRYDAQSSPKKKAAASYHEQPLAKVETQNRDGGAIEKEEERVLSLNRQERSNYDAALSDIFFSPKSFASIGASDEIIQSLRELNVKRPSDIQVSTKTCSP